MSAEVRLMELHAKTLPAPDQGNRVYYDTEVKGFGLRVTAKGVRSFVVNYRAGRIERRITIGRYPDWKVGRAREEAKRIKREVSLGYDPMAERHEDRAAAIMNDLCDHYLEEHASRKSESSKLEDGKLIDTYIRPELGRVRVHDVMTTEIEKLHRKISAHAPYRANRCLALLSKMFSLSIRWNYREDNPAKGIERNHEEKRERYLTPDEMKNLARALDMHEEKASTNAVRLLLLTGARRNEVLAATWEMFDLEMGVWSKPSAHTKQKRAHRVPLSGPAVELLKAMKEKADQDQPFLFPGGKKGQPITDIKKSWASICLKAGIKDCRLHDLRHTYASILASSGQSLPVIGALLGHTQTQTTSRYAHLFDNPLRAATETVGRVVMGHPLKAG